MARMQSAGHIHRYEPIEKREEQRRQRDWQVWFSAAQASPAIVETKCENYTAKNMTLELVSRLERGIPGCHVEFDNDWFFQAMLPDNDCYMYSGHEMYDEVTSKWQELGLKTHDIPNRDDKTGEEWTTRIALAPFTLLRERVSSLVQLAY